jgi:CheY-like chemotaxis protein
VNTTEGSLPAILGEVIAVEDDPAIRSLIEEIVGELSGRCVSFVTADEAIEHLQRHHGDCALIIADHGLPGRLRGAELVNLVRERWPNIPSILTSGYARELVCPPAHSIYLQKPWSFTTLTNAMRASLLDAGAFVDG